MSTSEDTIPAEPGRTGAGGEGAETTPLVQPSDLPALRDRYRAERDRRLRPDGLDQYRSATGALAPIGADPWSELPAVRQPVLDEVDALVVGGGFGGLTAAAGLRAVGLDRIRIVDKAGDVGGTWYWNRYPGVACDIESYVYMPLLEQVGEMPTRKYAPGEEIRRHAQAIARHYDLYRDALFGTEVTGMSWHDETSRWIVRTDRGDEVTARYVVISSGPFSQPKLPGVPGIEEFTGHMFHTSRWDYDYTGGDHTGGMHKLADKRVAVIGTGATGIQVVPHLALDARHVYVVQRTPSTVDVRGDHETDPDWWASLEPGWQRRRRENFLQLLEAKGAAEDLVADRWTDTAPVRAGMKLRGGEGLDDIPLMMELVDAQKMAELRTRVDEIVDDPHVADLLKPWYRQMCKRPGFSDRYLQSFNRDNVTLLDTAGRGAERFTADGIVVAGIEYGVDAVLFATGFDLVADPARRAGVDIRGRGGITLADYWADGLRTLHGYVSRNFPNLLQMGTGQNAVAVNFAHILEAQADHLCTVVAEAEQQDAIIEPSEAAEQCWVDAVRESAVQTAAFFAECTPGYYNSEGRPRTRNELFGRGPIEFHRLLAEWRESGDRGDVLRPRD